MSNAIIQRTVLIAISFLFFLPPSILLAQEQAWWRQPYDRGIALLEESDLDGAKLKFNEIIARDEEVAYAYIGLGLVADKREPGSREARGYFEKAIKTDRDCAEAYYQLGKHFRLVKNGDFGARKNFEACIRKDPQHWQAWLELAELQKALWGQGGVFSIYRDALSYNPDRDEITGPFLEAAVWYGKQSEAIEMLQELSQRYPEKSNLLYNLALLQFDVEDYSTSLATLATLRKDFPDFSPAQIYYLRAKNYFQLDDLRRGHISYTSALNSIQDSLDAQMVFADVYYIMTDEEVAELEPLPVEQTGDFYRRFWLSRDPDHSTSLNERIHEHFQRLAYARKHNRRFLANPLENELIYETVHPYANFNVHGHKLLEQSMMSRAIPLDRDIDDMGLIFVRHGNPDLQVMSVDGVPSYVNSGQLEAQLADEYAFADEMERNAITHEATRPVPRPYEGESLFSAGYFDNLPQNVSWKYVATAERPEMILHFKKFGGNLGWIIEAIPYTVAEREELAAGFIQLGRESFRASPVPADIVTLSEDLSDAGKRSSEISMATETSAHRFQGEPLTFPMHFVSFKSDSLLNTVEFYFAISGSQTELDSTGSLTIKRFLGLYDLHWNEAVSIPRREKLALNMKQEQWASSSFTEFERFQLSAGTYHFEAQLADLTGGKLGVYRGTYTVPDYSTGGLILSDILVSAPIGPAAGNPKFTRGNISYRPHMFTAFKKGEEVGLYLEIYNLTYDEQGQTNFRVSSTLQGASPGEGAISKVTGFFKSLLSEEEGAVGTSYDYQGASRDEKIYMNFQLPDALSGQYQLTVEVVDLLADKTVTRQAGITVE